MTNPAMFSCCLRHHSHTRTTKVLIKATSHGVLLSLFSEKDSQHDSIRLTIASRTKPILSQMKRVAQRSCVNLQALNVQMITVCGEHPHSHLASLLCKQSPTRQDCTVCQQHKTPQRFKCQLNTYPSSCAEPRANGRRSRMDLNRTVRVMQYAT
jgi:hypothetical protein